MSEIKRKYPSRADSRPGLVGVSPQERAELARIIAQRAAAGQDDPSIADVLGIKVSAVRRLRYATGIEAAQQRFIGGRVDPAQRVAERSVSADDGSGCIRWEGAHTEKGYGQISIASRNRPVHVVAYEAAIGPVPDGCEIDHVAARGCRWRDCVNPEHLEAVTHAENLARRRTPPPATHCAEGHELTDDNTKIRRRRDGSYRTCRRCFNDKRNARRALVGQRG